MTTPIHPLIADWYHQCPNCGTPLRPEPTAAHCDNCGFVFYVNPAPTVVLVIEQAGKILLAKRGIEPHKNQWDLPGGFVMINETPEQAAHRETKEETGLTIELITQLGSAYPDVYSDKQEPTLNFIFLAQPTAGTPKAMDDASALQWYAIDEIALDELAFENDRVAIQRYKTYRQEHHA